MGWRPMVEADLDAVMAVADRVHPSYPESAAVFAERLRLWSEGCAVLADRGRVAGYRISHPWRLAAPPRLDAAIGMIPLRPTTLFLHDLALVPEFRGLGHARAAVEATLALAVRLRLPNVTLLAVAGTTPFWSGMGFREGGVLRPAPDLDGYGSGAVAMVREAGARLPGAG